MGVGVRIISTVELIAVRVMDAAAVMMTPAVMVLTSRETFTWHCF